MLARGKGRIVNLVGGGTGNSFPNGSGYASSKAAIMRFTECLNDTTTGGGVQALAVGFRVWCGRRYDRVAAFFRKRERLTFLTSSSFLTTA